MYWNEEEYEDQFSPEAWLSQLALIECMGGMEAFLRAKDKMWEANGGRRQRILTIEQVMLCCVRPALTHPDGYLVVTGGTVNSKYAKKYGGESTVAMAVRISECQVVCDVGVSPAYRPWPSKVWPELCPWKFQGEPIYDRLKEWAKKRARKQKQLFLWHEAAND
jgi:hypothetical protein